MAFFWSQEGGAGTFLVPRVRSGLVLVITGRNGHFNFLGPVDRRPISTNPGLNFNPGVFFSLSIALSRIISSILFRVFFRQIVDGKN